MKLTLVRILYGHYIYFSLGSHKYLRHSRLRSSSDIPQRNKFETNFTTICGAECRILQQFFELWLELRDSHYILRSRYDRLFPSSSELLVPEQASCLLSSPTPPSSAVPAPPSPLRPRSRSRIKSLF